MKAHRNCNAASDQIQASLIWLLGFDYKGESLQSHEHG